MPFSSSTFLGFFFFSHFLVTLREESRVIGDHSKQTRCIRSVTLGSLPLHCKHLKSCLICHCVSTGCTYVNSKWSALIRRLLTLSTSTKALCSEFHILSSHTLTECFFLYIYSTHMQHFVLRRQSIITPCRKLTRESFGC